MKDDVTIHVFYGQPLFEEEPTGMAASSVLMQMYSLRRAVMIMATMLVIHHAHE
jgi:hypothetical protein